MQVCKYCSDNLNAIVRHRSPYCIDHETARYKKLIELTEDMEVKLAETGISSLG